MLRNLKERRRIMDNFTLKDTDVILDGLEPLKEEDLVIEPGEYLTPIRRNPGESITMSFPDAIRQIIAGEKVKRLEWPVDTDHGLLKDGWLTIFTKNDKDLKQEFHTWSVSDGDMEAQDWIVVKELNATN